MRRAQGLPLNTIIIAILVVLVLVVILLLFTSSMSSTSQALRKNTQGGDCVGLGGSCVPFASACPTNAGYTLVKAGDCKTCCLPPKDVPSGGSGSQTIDPGASGSPPPSTGGVHNREPVVTPSGG